MSTCGQAAECGILFKLKCNKQKVLSFVIQDMQLDDIVKKTSVCRNHDKRIHY